jgi:tRNA U34 5-methylaminomethyl-2-thiouridine-forming methyltransferase MnmC
MSAIKPIPPKGHSYVETADGTLTLFSDQFQEACHSTSGAKQETLLHYIKGCQIVEKLQGPGPLSILEVGFGLGIGFLTTYETLFPIDRPWSFLSLEIDEHLLEWFRQENMGHAFLKDLKWEEESGLKWLEAKNDRIQLKILCGDARIQLANFLKKYPLQWNAIYQDAFSPKRNPALWTKEWFALLKAHALDDVLLSTYSSSSSIRKSLMESGWILSKGEKFGPKRSSTRASLRGEADPEILLQLERSPVSALSDDNISEIKRS